jgi:nitric oxide dioxygenase
MYSEYIFWPASLRAGLEEGKFLMPAPLSPDTIALVKATVPALKAHGLAITQTMYGHLFKDEEIRDLFNQSHQGASGSQPKALAGAVLAYAENIDNLAALAPAVERIAQKHAGLNILPEHYPYVASALLKAIAEVLGEAATDAILKAWGEAYWFLAEILLGREAEIYRAQAAAPGGWAGWRAFVVERVEAESEIIKSFYLRPADGAQVIRHQPGQYLTFKLDVSGHGTLKRNYSISSAPSDTGYRITVKREPAPADRPDAPAGLASNWLHDQAAPGTVLQVAPPAGDFVLEVGERPLVLLSGGVGLTPMVSMLEAIVQDGAPAETWYVHGAQNRRVHAMGGRIRELEASNEDVTAVCFYAEPEADDVHGEHYDEHGFISVDWLRRHTPFEEALFYLCGPKPFLRALVTELLAAGVDASRIRYEFFGPPEELQAA